MYHTQPRLTDITFVALDTETTGIFPIMHRLVEIGAIRFRSDGRELATFQQLIDPQIPIPPNVQQVPGITDRMVCGKPTIEHVLPQFIKFLGHRDTILLAHNALFDLSFLAMALTRLGITFPPHNVFLTMLQRTPTLKRISELMRVSQPLTLADTPVCAIDPPAGFEALSTAIAERCAIAIVYEQGWQRPQPRMITPRLVLKFHGVAYVIALGHLSGAERTFRLDRIRECWLY
jgi:hypothetical protein